MSSSTTNLCDLPPELVGLIAERTDIRSRCVLRKSSKDIRQVVDDSKHVCDKISVHVEPWDQSIYFAIDNFPRFGYTLKENGCMIRVTKRAISPFATIPSGFPGQSAYKFETFLNGEDYVEVAVNDLMTILKNPKLIIKNLIISDGRNDNEESVPPFTAALLRKLSELDLVRIRTTHSVHSDHHNGAMEAGGDTVFGGCSASGGHFSF